MRFFRDLFHESWRPYNWCYLWLQAFLCVVCALCALRTGCRLNEMATPNPPEAWALARCPSSTAYAAQWREAFDAKSLNVPESEWKTDGRKSGNVAVTHNMILTVQVSHLVCLYVFCSIKTSAVLLHPTNGRIFFSGQRNILQMYCQGLRSSRKGWKYVNLEALCLDWATSSL